MSIPISVHDGKYAVSVIQLSGVLYTSLFIINVCSYVRDGLLL
jgi:hypothetical protein